ncbi:unnamed protein product [Parajaminaea phylloscopi]
MLQAVPNATTPPVYRRSSSMSIAPITARRTWCVVVRASLHGHEALVTVCEPASLASPRLASLSPHVHAAAAAAAAVARRHRDAVGWATRRATPPLRRKRNEEAASCRGRTSGPDDERE